MVIGAPARTLKTSAIDGESIPIRGISASLIAGIEPRLGSAYNKVCVDFDAVRKLSEEEDEVMDELLSG